MDKNKIKDYLTKTFISEAKMKGADSTPGIKLTQQMKNKSGKENKDGVKAIAKDMKAYEKSLGQTDSNEKDMGTNKFNYTDDNEKNYHDQMEIMNGQEMVQYDRTPNKEFKERALEAIEGSARMGNSNEWANIVAKGQGGDPEFGKNLVKQIKASEEKRNKQTRTTKMFGNDWEVTEDEGHKSYAFENTAKKSTINESFPEKNTRIMTGWVENLGAKEAAVKLLNQLSQTGLVSDLPDSIEYGNGLNRIAAMMEKGSFEMAFKTAKTLATKLERKAMRDMMGESEFGANMEENIHNTPQMGGVTSSKGVAGYIDDTSKQDKEYSDSIRKPKDPMQGLDADYEKLDRETKYGKNPYNENTNKNKPQIKESMKRLKFKKEFNGVGNALKMIPESYKTDSKVFEMTDGNESYRVRWEGTLTEGKAVVLMAADKKMVNEDIQKMKHLMGYKSEATLGAVKGKARIDENKAFTDVYTKTKKLFEMEDIDGQDAEKEAQFDDADISQAPEAKKHIQGSTSTDKGTKAPKPKVGYWDKISVPQASEANKHVQGSTSSDKGMKAPKAKTGDLDDAVSQAPEAKKHVADKKGTITPSAKTGQWDNVKKKA